MQLCLEQEWCVKQGKYVREYDEKYICEARNFWNECNNVVHSARANYFSVTKAKYRLKYYERVS